MAQAVMAETFTYRDDVWRGLGTIPDSGYGLQAEFAAFDAAQKFAFHPGGQRGGHRLQVRRDHLWPSGANAVPPVRDGLRAGESGGALYGLQRRSLRRGVQISEVVTVRDSLEEIITLDYGSGGKKNRQPH